MYKMQSEMGCSLALMFNSLSLNFKFELRTWTPNLNSLIPR